MIYKEEVKDLFTVPEDYYLAHCISADFGMGKGIVVEFNKRFDGRGGGKPEMVQGTVRGEKEAIERWLMKYEFVCI